MFSTSAKALNALENVVFGRVWTSDILDALFCNVKVILGERRSSSDNAFCTAGMIDFPRFDARTRVWVILV